MNPTPGIDHPELGTLGEHVAALKSDRPDHDSTLAAQQALEQRLRQQTGRGIIASRWRPVLWVSPALALIIAALVLFVGGPGGPHPAFAEVQRHFVDFETLYADTRFAVLGKDMWRMEIFVQRDGRSRIEMDAGVGYVVDPEQGLMLVLMHESATAQRVEFPANDRTAGMPDELDWLVRIREFQGMAKRLPRQQVRGRWADGFQLDQEGYDMTIWAAEDGTPLRMTGEFASFTEGEAVMTLDFDFDQALDPALFDTDLPPGYRWTHEKE